MGKSALSGDSGHGGNDVNSMSDDEEGCGCNGVCKGDIVNAIKDKDLKSLGDVKSCTKSWSFLWKLFGLVEQILVNTLGMNIMLLKREFVVVQLLGHKEIKAGIDAGEFDSVYDVFKKT